MWTLIVFVFLSPVAGGGGASTTISNYQFETEKLCNDGIKAVSDTGDEPGNIAHWRIIGKCIHTKKYPYTR